MLQHTGRKSGARRHVVLEVVERRAPGTYIAWFPGSATAPSGSGTSAPTRGFRVYALSRKQAAATARVLPPQEAAAVLAAYSACHPRAWAAMKPVLRDALAAGAATWSPGCPVVALESGREG